MSGPAKASNVFMFDFGGDEVEAPDASAQTTTDGGDKGPPCTEVPSPKWLVAQSYVISEIGSSSVSLKHLSVNSTALLKTDVAFADTVQHSDLSPGVYEGGFKLWECSVDLVHEMLRNPAMVKPVDESRVVELGCGLGLPGIAAMKVGASSVDFLDYNAEVVQYITLPNILLNTTPVSSLEDLVAQSQPQCQGDRKFRCFSGDWRQFPAAADMGKYDVVLSSETFYTNTAIETLYAAIKRCLAKPHGVAYLSQKVYYFGVGGSVSHFESVVHNDGAFDMDTVKEYRDGKSNVRTILRLRWRKPS